VKNHRYILEAFLHLKDLQVSCDVYGQGALFEELERQSKEYGVNVHFKGQIEDSSRVLMNYDAYLMPSLSEGFPLALFEAMATGLPVIVSDIPVFREVLQNDGHYISLSQPRQLRSIVEYYMSLPHLIKEDGMRMRELARQKASKQKYFENLKSVYSELLKEKSTLSF
jgi:glycosyltransferase involved in cell wall biosynthesis